MQLDRADLVRYNWLPFTDDEADYLAFGTKVSTDSLPAVAEAVRLTTVQVDFDVDEGDDLRLVH